MEKKETSVESKEIKVEAQPVPPCSPAQEKKKDEAHKDGEHAGVERPEGLPSTPAQAPELTQAHIDSHSEECPDDKKKEEKDEADKKK